MIKTHVSRRSFVAFTLLAVLLIPQNPASPDDVGILVIAHGDYETQWNQLVKDSLASLRDKYLLEIGFLLPSPGETLQDAIDRLEKRNVRTIVAVPLLISSHSEHFDELAYYLGKRSTRPELAEHSPVHYEASLILTDGLDYDPAISDVLLGFARELSVDPNAETVIVIGHGPNDPEYNRRWMENIQQITTELDGIGGFRSVLGLTLRDDADLETQAEAMRQIRRAVAEAANDGSALVVPLMVATGSVQQGIRVKLEGLEYRMSEQGLSSHADFVARWVEGKIKRALADLTNR